MWLCRIIVLVVGGYYVTFIGATEVAQAQYVK